jgi:hypothetical protein
MDSRDDRNALSDYEPEHPSLVGVSAMFIAAGLVTLLALAVLVEWGPIGEWEDGNTAGSVVLDAFALALAAWVDSRALRTWRRFRAPPE